MGCGILKKRISLKQLVIRCHVVKTKYQLSVQNFVAACEAFSVAFPLVIVLHKLYYCTTNTYIKH